ncbi:uncharacterized protein [Chironomus tepperi]|uniref:uncharacterized protein n=1 Tax=Chironomus tepperi TaxID=113505 RepID=UPI00391F7081
MKKLKVIALLLSVLIEISSTISIYSIISDSEHVSNDNNRIPKKLQPVELMVDATNSLGFTILDLHSKLNKNNVAFSPCGLMSVLAALFEGSGGKSAVELKEALRFPRERDIVRIGTRDIHRRLRSYFYKKENLLSGLIFNKENITIKQEYETILRFYGYDLDGASNMLTDSKVDEMTNATEFTDSSKPSASSSTSTSLEMTTEVPTTNMSNTTETNVTGENVDEDLTTTPQSEEVSEDDTTTTNEANGTDDETTDDDENITTVASTRKRRGRLGRGLRGKHRRDKKQSSPSTYVAQKNRAINRRSRSYEILDYENEFHLEAVTQYSPLTSLSTTSIIPTTSKSSSLSSHHAYHEHNHHHHQPSSTENPIHTPRSTAAEKRRINNHKDLFENVNSDTIEHIFYLNEYETVRVPYKLYDTVMKYAYINSLQSSFLEIDLDSEYYNLIIIIPDFQDGLNTLTSKLRSHPASTLRFIRNSMDFHWIKTIVPKFHLKGNTILTSDLQNMGIIDIFEPTKADFSLMSDDDTLYVKNVEQMININIRTQSTQQLKKISSLYKRPTEVPVNIPFIYCVIDKKLDLIIILGRIINPLNSRIQ